VAITPWTEVPRLAFDDAVEELSDVVLWLLVGARVENEYRLNSLLARVTIGDHEKVFRVEDIKLAQDVADSLRREVLEPCGLGVHSLSFVPFLTKCRQWARDRFVQLSQEGHEKVRVAMLPADNTGCGYWRFKLPARQLQENNRLFMRLSDLPMTYDELLNYDVIVLQRSYDFEQLSVVKNLRNAGRKIVYEIDDDIFSVEPHNPAYTLYSRYEVQLGMKCFIEVADRVMTTTTPLAKALNISNKAIVYPNSLDIGQFTLRKDFTKTASRIVWSGSTTHDHDFEECLEALLKLMAERKKLEVLVIGGLPKCLDSALKVHPEFNQRVLRLPFMRVESYFHLLASGVDADLGIVPLASSKFNDGKSTCKGLEYTAAGLAVVASRASPYGLVYDHEVNAMLPSRPEDWYKNIARVLDDCELRKKLVMGARVLAARKFGLKENVSALEEELYQLGRPMLEKRLAAQAKS
jgi:glycosyltransferase involved in cell wall biosynthesis